MIIKMLAIYINQTCFNMSINLRRDIIIKSRLFFERKKWIDT